MINFTPHCPACGRAIHINEYVCFVRWCEDCWVDRTSGLKIGRQRLCKPEFKSKSKIPYYRNDGTQYNNKIFKLRMK